jgi:hypothetical protein
MLSKIQEDSGFQFPSNIVCNGVWYDTHLYYSHSLWYVWALHLQPEVDGLLVDCVQGVDFLDAQLCQLQQQFLHTHLPTTIRKSNNYIYTYEMIYSY